MERKVIYSTTFDKTRKEIQASKDKEVIFIGSDDELNRKILEKQDVNIFAPILQGRHDKQKQRDSGFNQVLAKVAKKKNVIVGILLDEIINASGSNKAELLARVRQNIKLCNKNKVNMKFIATNAANERNLHDLKALGLVLGMPTWMTSAL